MLVQIMRETNNFFVNPNQIEQGKYKIENERINLTGKYAVGQYIAVAGSILNNGIYLLKEDTKTLSGAINEEFEGVIYGLDIPQDFLNLVEEIKRFQKDQGTPTNVVSEKFDAFSQTLAVGSNGMVAGWQMVFSQQLGKFRKMFAEIKL